MLFTAHDSDDRTAWGEFAASMGRHWSARVERLRLGPLPRSRLW